MATERESMTERERERKSAEKKPNKEKKGIPLNRNGKRTVARKSSREQ